MDKIQPINSIDALEVYKILSSEKFTDNQKAQFIKKNATAIKNIAKVEISKEELEMILAQRPLVRFRPLKNSFTKQGDDIMFSL